MSDVARDIMTCPQEKVLSSVTQPISLPDSSCVCLHDYRFLGP